MFDVVEIGCSDVVIDEVGLFVDVVDVECSDVVVGDVVSLGVVEGVDVDC